jgi:hypothetical protein
MRYQRRVRPFTDLRDRLGHLRTFDASGVAAYEVASASRRCSSRFRARAHSCGPRPADRSRRSWPPFVRDWRARFARSSRSWPASLAAVIASVGFGCGSEVGRLVGDQGNRGGHGRGQVVACEVGDHLLDAFVRGGCLLEEQLAVAAHHQRPHRRTGAAGRPCVWLGPGAGRRRATSCGPHRAPRNGWRPARRWRPRGRNGCPGCRR